MAVRESERPHASMSVEEPRAVSLAVLRTLLAGYEPGDVAVRLWDGTTWQPEPGVAPRFTLALKHPGALRRMFGRPGELALSEAYVYDDFDVEGDIEAAFRLADHLLRHRRPLLERLRLRGLLSRLPAEVHGRPGRQAARLRGPVHSRERDRQAVTYHYDVSNDFFALFLGERMVYTCAYFATPDEDLDVAQARKLDYLCRKLRLSPGERLLDIGCGWGGLVLHAAERYGVHALGVTLSRPQAELARERIQRAGLADRCRVEVMDYRDIAEPEGFDKIVSVGMFEHLRRFMLRGYFQHVWRLLRPRGAFLNHGIAGSALLARPSTATFNDRYLFPDSEVVPISTTLRAAEAVGFEVRDVESLREHYALTVRHWRRRLEARREEAVRLTDEATYRIWRLATSGAAHRFGTGRQNLYQVLFVKPEAGASGLPLTRADWYA
jgi:cyclopropane-fatty-acyl-phospholipid synthase